MKKAKFLLMLCVFFFVATGCKKEKAMLVQKGTTTYVENQVEEVSFEEAAEEFFEEESDVYTLIENDIRIGSPNEDLEQITMDKYSDADSYMFFVNSELYGHVSSGIIETFTIRLDSEPISGDKGRKIIDALLPEDAVFENSYNEKPYVFYEYSSDSLPSPGKIKVKMNSYGTGVVSVIGITADIGNTVYIGR